MVKFFKTKMSLSMFCDGGSRGNPGPAAIGFVVFKDDKEMKRFSQRIGETTNNVAEYKAVIAALRWLSKNRAILDFSSGQKPRVNFYLDSQLVVSQLQGLYKVKSLKLQGLVIAAKNLEKQMDLPVFYHLVTRTRNKIADSLVNQALNKTP